MPFADIVEASIVMPGLVEEPTEFGPDLVNVTHKRRECPLSMYRQFPNNKLIRADVLGQEDPANLTPASVDQGSLTPL